MANNQSINLGALREAELFRSSAHRQRAVGSPPRHFQKGKERREEGGGRCAARGLKAMGRDGDGRGKGGGSSQQRIPEPGRIMIDGMRNRSWVSAGSWVPINGRERAGTYVRLAS
uniref:Uncharacterized protein n=1 Tax=Leersia perrieri TaxID=77586 RepID=A0A0D9V4W6_9ORYZ